MQKKIENNEDTIDLQAILAQDRSAQKGYDFYRDNFTAELDPKYVEALAGKHFVLVVGLGARQLLGAEKITNREEELRYFAALKKLLEKMPGTSVDIVYPHSRDIDHSARQVIRHVKKLKAQQEYKDKEFVIIGQSRGGTVASRVALMAPELIVGNEKNGEEGFIKKIMTLQSPVNGHAYTANPVVEAIASFIPERLLPGGLFGLGALTDKNLRKTFNPEAIHFALNPEYRDAVHDALLYFTSYSPDLPVLPWLAGTTDGLVTLINQFRTDIGSVAGCVQVNHIQSVIKAKNKNNDVRRDPSEAFAYVTAEALAKNILYGSDYAHAVSTAEQDHVRIALNNGPRVTLLPKQRHQFPHCQSK